jgi:hypothetical protein
MAPEVMFRDRVAFVNDSIPRVYAAPFLARQLFATSLITPNTRGELSVGITSDKANFALAFFHRSAFLRVSGW